MTAMENNTNTLIPFDLRWDKLQEPGRPARKPADYLLLLSALDEGWQIVETTRLLDPDRQSGDYLLTLFHPTRLLLHQLTVSPIPEVEWMLKDEAMTIIHRQGDPN